ALAVEESAVASVATSQDDEILPIFDEPSSGVGPATEVVARPAWPGISWERTLLDGIEHPGLPAVLDTFFEGDFQYLVEEVPQGKSLWDAWDDPDIGNQQRFGYLVKVAELLQTLHRVGAIIEGIRPDIFVITDEGNARVTDLSDLLPLPIPPEALIHGRH